MDFNRSINPATEFHLNTARSKPQAVWQPDWVEVALGVNRAALPSIILTYPCQMLRYIILVSLVA